MGNLDDAVMAYEQALRHNMQSIQAMNAISCILRTKENFPRAVEFLQAILKLDSSNGEVWGSLGKYIVSIYLEQLADTTRRSLLPYDGRSPTSLCCLSASAVSPKRSEGPFSPHPYLHWLKC